MVKLVAFVKRKEGLSLDEFYAHWFDVHGPLITNTPELARHIVRYEQLRPTDHADWMRGSGFDGVTIHWIESPAEFEAFVNEPKYAEVLMPDEDSFLDRDSLVWMITDEPQVTIDGPMT